MESIEKAILKKTKPNSKKYGICEICGCALGKYHMDAGGGIKFCSFKCADEYKNQHINEDK